jgi:hypothetical protein
MTNLYSAGRSGKQNIERDAPVTCDACGRRVARIDRHSWANVIRREIGGAW